MKIHDIAESGHGKVLTITQDGKKLASVRLVPAAYHQIVHALRSHSDKVKTSNVEAVARELKNKGHVIVGDVELTFVEKKYKEMK